jgi:hypothetical protein
MLLVLFLGCLKQMMNNNKASMGTNIKNTFFECPTMWNEMEINDQEIVFTLPTHPIVNHQMMRKKGRTLKSYLFISRPCRSRTMTVTTLCSFHGITAIYH